LSAKLGLRAKLFIATKVWTQGKDAGVRQMQESMRKLRADRIDLMQVHNLIDVDTHLQTLTKWKQEGRVRYIGVTHHTSSAYEAVERISRGAEVRLSADQLFGERTPG
jgi:diketogulonate reductase-like aldo/keto reductase